MPPTSGWNRTYEVQVECAGDDCLCKRGELVHPPLLVAFDPVAGEYRRAEGICTAQWAQAQRGRIAGHICGREAGEQIGDVWLCEYHYQRARQWFKEVMPRIDRNQTIEHLNTIQAEVSRRAREDHNERMRLQYEEASRQRELDKERVRAEIAARAGRNLVYYLRRADGSIKIGTSGNVLSRASALARDHGPLHLMAAHVGGREQERALHVQFGALRISPREEWFRPGLELLEHIRKTRKECEVLEAKNLPVVDLKEIGREIHRLQREARAA